MGPDRDPLFFIARRRRAQKRMIDNAVPASPEAALDEPRLIGDSSATRPTAAVAAPILRDLGLRLVRVKISRADGGTVQIMVERPDGGMNVEDCERASVALSPAFDVADLVSHPYRLEISSPGLDRPLVRLSDFERAVGHELRIEMATPVGARKRFRGVIESVTPETGALRLRAAADAADEATIFELPIRDMAEARLVLTEDLIREVLRTEKAAKKQTKPAAKTKKNSADKPLRRARAEKGN